MWKMDERLALQTQVERITKSYGKVNFEVKDCYSQTVDALLALGIATLKANTLATELRREFSQRHAMTAPERATKEDSDETA